MVIGEPETRAATCADFLKVPDNLMAEIINGRWIPIPGRHPAMPGSPLRLPESSLSPSISELAAGGRAREARMCRNYNTGRTS